MARRRLPVSGAKGVEQTDGRTDGRTAALLNAPLPVSGAKGV